MIYLDIILILLTTTCIIYCSILSKRIIQIDHYRNELVSMFKEFDKSVSLAQTSLTEIKTLTITAEAFIQEIDTKQNYMGEKLSGIIEKADKLAEELDIMMISGKNLLTKLKEAEKSAGPKVMSAELLNSAHQSIHQDSSKVNYDLNIGIDNRIFNSETFTGQSKDIDNEYNSITNGSNAPMHKAVVGNNLATPQVLSQQDYYEFLQRKTTETK